MAFEAVQLEAEPDDGRLAAPDAQPVEVGRDLRADRHELGRQPAQEALDAQEERGGEAPEIPVQHVAVERVHPDGDPGQGRRQPAQCPRLGEVGGHDRRPHAPEVPVEPDQREQVVDRGQAAPQVGDVDDLRAGLPGLVLHRSLPLVGHAGQQHRVELRPASRGQDRHVTGRPSDVHSRHDADELRLADIRQKPYANHPETAPSARS